MILFDWIQIISLIYVSYYIIIKMRKQPDPDPGNNPEDFED